MFVREVQSQSCEWLKPDCEKPGTSHNVSTTEVLTMTRVRYDTWYSRRRGVLAAAGTEQLSRCGRADWQGSFLFCFVYLACVLATINSLPVFIQLF